jgi:hypothetical protein
MWARSLAGVSGGLAMFGWGSWSNLRALTLRMTNRHVDEALLGMFVTVGILMVLWRAVDRRRWHVATGALSGYLAGVAGALVAFYSSQPEQLALLWSRPWSTLFGIAAWSVLSYAWVMGLGLFVALSTARHAGRSWSR